MESVRIDRQTRMDIAELKAELQQLHSASFGWALSCCGRDREEAEEVLQTVYLKILEGKAQFRGEASLKTWLFAVIRKTAIGERRKNLVRRLILDSGTGHTAPAEVPEQPAAVFERSETQA